MPKVKCADCACYKFQNGLVDEPLGGCMSDDSKVIPPIYSFMYNGLNWRLNERSSNVLRRCEGFIPKGSPAKVWSENEE
jgi:hypothetical protein